MGYNNFVCVESVKVRLSSSCSFEFQYCFEIVVTRSIKDLRIIILTSPFTFTFECFILRDTVANENNIP